MNPSCLLKTMSYFVKAKKNALALVMVAKRTASFAIAKIVNVLVANAKKSFNY